MCVKKHNGLWNTIKQRFLKLNNSFMLKAQTHYLSSTITIAY